MASKICDGIRPPGTRRVELIQAIGRALGKACTGPRSPWLLGGLLALGQPATAFELADLDGSNGFVVNGISPWRHVAVSAAGDVNGDGVADFVIGEPGADFDVGHAYVVFGSGEPFTAEIELSSLDGSDGFVFEGLYPWDWNLAGASVSSAGDVNGDGIDDLLVGEPGLPYSYHFGYAHIVFGHTGDLPARLTRADLDGANGFSIPSPPGGRQLGALVASAGDLNRDGYGDLLMASNYPYEAGQASYVVFGHPGPFIRDLDVSTLDGSDGFTIAKPGVRSGGAGDFNGDGIDDLILASGDFYSDARATVVFGDSGGFPALISLDGVDEGDGFTLVAPDIPPDNSDYSGSSNSTLAAAAGDVNGDGVEDMLVRVNSTVEPGHEEVRCYLIFGTRDAVPPVVDLGGLNGNDGVTYFASRPYRLSAISAAGDIDGDGFDDFLIGSPDYRPDGLTYVLFGHARQFSSTIDLLHLDAQDGIVIKGVAGSPQTGAAVAGIEDVNSDAFDDILISGDAVAYVVFGSPDFGQDEPPVFAPPPASDPPPLDIDPPVIDPPAIDPPVIDPPPGDTSSGGGAADLSLLALACLGFRRFGQARSRGGGRFATTACECQPRRISMRFPESYERRSENEERAGRGFCRRIGRTRCKSGRLRVHSDRLPWIADDPGLRNQQRWRGRGLRLD